MDNILGSGLGSGYLCLFEMRRDVSISGDMQIL
jgi:hypothetical protein